MQTRIASRHKPRDGSGRRLLLAWYVAAALAVITCICACSGGDSEPAPVNASAAQESSQSGRQPQAVAPEADGDSLPHTPLKLGLLLDFSGPLAEYGPEMRKGFELAIKHINEAGGVWGMPVEGVAGDTAQDSTIAVEEARRLIEIEGVHGLVGPMSSAMTLAVAESVSGSAGIPTISPVATSSQITLAEDDDFLFRVSLADRVEGQYLARVAQELGFNNVGLLYRDDAFGQGMASAFEQHWPGTLQVIAIDPRASSFTAELEQSVALGARALVLVTFPPETILILREALEFGYYDQFVFSAPTKTTTISAAIGAEPLAGMRGTFVDTTPANEASDAWMMGYLEEYGAPPAVAYVKETYDATLALALAAEAAGSSDGAAIRDQLRRISSAPGLVVIPHPESIAAGLQAAGMGADIDYDGAAGPLDWDQQGDSVRGFIGIWEFAEDGSITDLEVIAVVDQ